MADMVFADPRFNYHNRLGEVSQRDLDEVVVKDRSYGASWKKRGGVGAFMMLARKWDRLEEILTTTYGYDIFTACEVDMSGQDGTVLAEIRDLRRYLLLVEAEVMQQTRELNTSDAPGPIGGTRFQGGSLPAETPPRG